MSTATENTPACIRDNQWILLLWDEATLKVPDLKAHIPSLPPARSNLSRSVKICVPLLGFATLTYWTYDTIYRCPLFTHKDHNWVANLKYLGIPTAACGLFAWVDHYRHQNKEKQAILMLNGKLNVMFTLYGNDTQLPTVKGNLQTAFRNFFPGHPLPNSLA